MERFRVSTDSRLVKPGEYFVAIKGENTDGHKFIEAALRNGACGVLGERELYKAAKDRINLINPIIIGVTGSSGKTTVTAFICQILSTKYNCCLGSLNTKLGLSVNVLNDMDEKCKFFIAEMGMDKAGELKETTDMFPPDFTVITTINHVHLEKLGTVAAIANAKAEILYGMKTTGTAVLNSRNNWIRKVGVEFANTGGKVLWFSEKPPAEELILPKDILGEHNHRNIVCAAIVANLCGLSYGEISVILNNIKLPKGRLNLITGIHRSIIIDDTYNANPESMKYALEVLCEVGSKRKVAILGDMLELGKFSARDHIKVGQLINRLAIDRVACVGERSSLICAQINSGTAHRFFSNTLQTQEIVRWLKIREGDTILVKGSQGVRMERITKALMENPEKAPDLLVRQDARWNN